MFTSPQFGKSQSTEDIARYSASAHYESGQFINQIPTHTGNFFKALTELPKMLDQLGNPKNPIPTDFSSILINSVDSTTQITWFGHSAFLIELEGKRILIDPMLPKMHRPSPLVANGLNTPSLFPFLQ